MTSTELQQVMARVGGTTHLTAILLQIERADKCKLVLRLAQSLTKAQPMQEFFADRGKLPSGFYLYIEEDCPHYEALPFDFIHLIYGYCREDGSGLENTYPFIRTAGRHYSLIAQPDYLQTKAAQDGVHFNQPT